VKIAQRRALIAWNRAVTPAGTSVALGGIGADALGRSGQTGHVDTHFWERFGSAALISVFGLAPQFAVDDEEEVADAIDAMGDDLESSSRSALDAYLRIAPTINIDQGDRLTIFVNRDLIF
jgi:type IV secretion system protein VirB10